MPQAKKSSLLHTAYRFFIIGKFFGLSCFSIRKDKSYGKHTVVTRYDVTLLIGFLFLSIFLTYENIVHPKNITHDVKEKVIFNTTIKCIVAASSIVCFPVTLKVFFDREKLWTVFFDIMNVDKRVN